MPLCEISQFVLLMLLALGANHLMLGMPALFTCYFCLINSPAFTSRLFDLKLTLEKQHAVSLAFLSQQRYFVFTLLAVPIACAVFDLTLFLVLPFPFLKWNSFSLAPHLCYNPSSPTPHRYFIGDFLLSTKS